MVIESYTFGEIRIDGRTYSRDVVIYPNRVDDRWWRKEGHELCPEDLTEVLGHPPEILVVGTGYMGCMRILPATEAVLKVKGIEWIAKPTRQACEEYNHLSGHRRVIAALHLTC